MNIIMESELVIKIGNLLNEVRNKKPLVHNITNYVTVNDCANILLAIGASPIMADDIKEAADVRCDGRTKYEKLINYPHFKIYICALGSSVEVDAVIELPEMHKKRNRQSNLCERRFLFYKSKIIFSSDS